MAKIYSHIPDERYKQAFENGIGYILAAQYKNGGWPQYFPIKDPEDEIRLDKTEPYSMHITYNDDAMVNTMWLLKDIYSGNKALASLQISDDLKTKVKKAFDNGVECILNTQIVVDGKRTVWCAQHNSETLAPANARTYELASFSGSESISIIALLMDIETPSTEIVAAVTGAIYWLENHKIKGIQIATEIDKNGKKNRIVVEDKNAPALWARFYDLKTGEPYFCDRDGIKKSSMAEISHERRNGYSWFTSKPKIVLEKYPEWAKQHKIKQG